MPCLREKCKLLFHQKIFIGWVIKLTRPILFYNRLHCSSLNARKRTSKHNKGERQRGAFITEKSGTNIERNILKYELIDPHTLQ